MALSFRQYFLLIVVVLPGLFGFGFCMYFAIQDWQALQKAYIHFIQISSTSHDMKDLFIAEAKQNIHRINIFAEIVWALLSATIACIGIHGICTSTNPKKHDS